MDNQQTNQTGAAVWGGVAGKRERGEGYVKYSKARKYVGGRQTHKCRREKRGEWGYRQANSVMGEKAKNNNQSSEGEAIAQCTRRRMLTSL